MKDKKGMIEILACYVMWGIFPVFWKLLAELNAVYVLSSRIIWSAVFCFVILLVTGKTEELKRTLSNRYIMKKLMCSGIAVAINWGLYIYAVNSGHILDASLAYYLNPLMAIALGFCCFKEKLEKRQWISIGVATFGIIIAIAMYGTVPVFALIIGGSFAVYGAIKKNVTCSGLVSTMIEATFLSPFAMIYIIWSESTGCGAIGTFHGMQFLLLPLAGIVTSVPLLAYSAGITKISMSLSGILMYVNPTLQLLLGVCIYHEEFDIARKIMFVCVWVAVILFVSGKRKKSQG